MRIDDYFKLHSALKRNQELVELCSTLRLDSTIDRRKFGTIKRRARGLVEELTKLKAAVDQRMNGG